MIYDDNPKNGKNETGLILTETAEGHKGIPVK